MNAKTQTLRAGLVPRLAVLALFSIIASSSFAAPPAGEPLPSMDEIRQLADAKQWQPMLQKIARVVSLNGQAGSAYDKYELLMLRGEAYLQMKQTSSAVSAFGAAGKEAGSDEKKRAVADASAALVKRAGGGTYTRKSPASQPTDPKTLDITDRSTRTSAFAALAADDAAALAPKIKTATAGQTLNPIAELIKPAAELRETEVASRDDNSTPLTTDMLTALAKHAKELETQSITDMRTRVDAIEKNANTLEDHGPSRSAARGNGSGYGPGPDHTFRKRGLTGQDTQALRDVVNTCKQLVSASKEFATAFGKELGGDFEGVAKDATDLATKANQVMTADYSQPTHNPSNSR